ncbi:MAG: homoserine kinase [Gemmatimonadaceae bacterium]|nr:homoserine kinase [Gemmatimonadaceae bacterium]
MTSHERAGSARQPQSIGEPGRTVRATAPGGIGNLGPGLDILGCAVTGLADRVTAWRDGSAGVRIVAPGHPELPSDPSRHASAIAAQALLERAALEGQRPFGVALILEKGLPLAGGQGGSAASAVAGAAAANALLDDPLDRMAVLDAALVAESIVAGHHLDNVAPCVLGGIVLVRSIDPVDLVTVAVPQALRIVLALPEMQVRTRDARSVLPEQVARATALYQAAQVAAIVAACSTGDLELLGRAIDDRIAEPARAPMLPGFAEAKRAAMTAGALGCSISGAGPTSFALASSDAGAAVVAAAMVTAYDAAGLRCTARVARVSGSGVVVEPVARPAHHGSRE